MRRSLEWLITEYQKRLFAAAYNICGNAEDACDVVQETFIQYYSTDKEFNDETHLYAWLLRVAINKAKNIRRASWNVKVSLDDTFLVNTPAKGADESILEEILRLPEKYRIIIHLHYYEGFSVKEIAEMLGISEGSAKMRLSRGRSLLKKILQKEERS